MGARQGETITNILGGFNRKLFINLVALLFLVSAAYLLCLVTLQMLVSSGALTSGTQATLPGAEPNQVIQIETEASVGSINMLNTAVALAVGAGLLLSALGLLRRARWAYAGTVAVSGAMIALMVLQALGGLGFSAATILQIVIFTMILLLFLFDRGIQALLWGNEVTS